MIGNYFGLSEVHDSEEVRNGFVKNCIKAQRYETCHENYYINLPPARLLMSKGHDDDTRKQSQKSQLENESRNAFAATNDDLEQKKSKSIALKKLMKLSKRLVNAFQ